MTADLSTTPTSTAAAPAPRYDSGLYLARRFANDYVRPHLGLIGMAMVLMMVSAAATGAMAKMMEPIIDKVFTAGQAGLLLPVAVTILLVFTARGFANYGHTVLMSKMGQLIVGDIQRRMFAHLVYADVSFYQGSQSGHLMSRFVTDTAMMRQAINDSVTGFGRNAFTLIFLVGVMFYQDWQLSILSLFVFPVVTYVVMRISKRLRRISKNSQQENGQLAAVLGQAFQGNKHVKAYGMEEFEQKRIGQTIQSIYELMYKAYKLSARATPLSEILSGVAIVAILTYGGHQIIQGASTAGKLFSFITAFLMAYEPMKRLARLNGTMQLGYAAIERMYLLLDEKPRIVNRPDARAIGLLHNPQIELDHVTFTYPDGTTALNDMSITVPGGKTVALVGESGSGKSTLLNLLPRFYDVTEGCIKIDGNDIRDIRLDSLRANMAFVSQDVAIFSDTVRDNIAYGTAGATEEQIIAAAKAAAAHDFIMELPQGYDTFVGENGVKLSGGQRQRISIARAFLRNAPILLLDEATSALDSNSERLVQEALDKLQKGRTTVVVAHRLSTIIGADLIYVMSRGQVVEQGSHDQLLAQGGYYARLYGQMFRESA